MLCCTFSHHSSTGSFSTCFLNRTCVNILNVLPKQCLHQTCLSWFHYSRLWTLCSLKHRSILPSPSPTNQNSVLQFGQVPPTVLFVVGRCSCPRGTAGWFSPASFTAVVEKRGLMRSFCGQVLFMLPASRNHLMALILSLSTKTTEQGNSRHSLYVGSPTPVTSFSKYKCINKHYKYLKRNCSWCICYSRMTNENSMSSLESSCSRTTVLKNFRIVGGTTM